MSVHVGSPSKAPVGDAPHRSESKQDRASGSGESHAALAVLMAVQLGWLMAVAYGGYWAIGTIGGLF